MSEPLASPSELRYPRLHLVAPVAADNPVTADPGLRDQFRPVMWGDRRRFEVRGTVTDTTVAIRTAQPDAESDLIVLDMAVLAGRGPRGDPEQARTARPCGRCRQLFSADQDHDPSALERWRLCGPCREVLIGPPLDSPAARVARRAHPAGAPKTTDGTRG